MADHDTLCEREYTKEGYVFIDCLCQMRRTWDDGYEKAGRDILGASATPPEPEHRGNPYRPTPPAALDDWGHYPYDHKSIAEIIYDFAVLRGDLSEEYARSQLVAAIERKIAHATRHTAPGATAGGEGE